MLIKDFRICELCGKKIHEGFVSPEGFVSCKKVDNDQIHAVWDEEFEVEYLDKDKVYDLAKRTGTDTENRTLEELITLISTNFCVKEFSKKRIILCRTTCLKCWAKKINNL
jgi:hypothetical protein